MIEKKKRYQFIALFLCLSLLLPSFSGMGIKVKAEYNSVEVDLTGESIRLDMNPDGSCKWTLTTSGTTGIIPAGSAITVSGTGGNILFGNAPQNRYPLIILKNLIFEGFGGYTTDLDIIIEGNVVSNSHLINTTFLEASGVTTITGVGDNYLKCNGYLVLRNNLYETGLVVSNVNMELSGALSDLLGDVSVSNCTVTMSQDASKAVKDSGIRIKGKGVVTVSNSSIDYFSPYNCTLYLDNSTCNLAKMFYINGGEIKNSTVNTSYVTSLGNLNIYNTVMTVNNIENHSILTIGKSNITTTAGEGIEIFSTENNSVILEENNSLVLRKTGSRNRFTVGTYSSSPTERVNPINEYAEPLFLNRVRIADIYESKDVTVQFDTNPEIVSLKTDNRGYLYFYLPAGKHTVVITEGSNVYNKTWQGATTDEYDTDGTLDNYIGDVDNGNPSNSGQSIIKSQSGNQKVVSGTSIDIYVVAEPDSPDKSLEYQWYKDDVEIPGEISDTLAKVAEDIDTGLYYCTVTQSDGKIEKSKDIQITVIDNPIQGDLDDLQDILDEIEDLLNGIPGSTPQEKIENLLDELEQARNDLDTVTNERDQARQELADLRSYVESLKDIVFGLSSGKTDAELKLRLEQVFSVLPQLQSDAELLEQVKDRLGLDPVASDQEVLDKIDELLNDGQSLDDIGDLLGVDPSDIINQITILINNTTILNQIIIILGSTKDDVVDDLNQIIADLTELENFVTEVRGILSLDPNASYSDIISAINALLQENTDLKQQLIDATNRITELEDLLNAETATNDQLIDQISQLQDDIDDLNQQLQDANADKDALNNQLADLQKQYDDLLDQLNEANTRINDLNQQISNLESEIDRLEQLIQDALDSLDDYEGADLLEKIKDIKDKKDKLVDDLNEANSINADLNDQITKANNRLAEMQAEIDRLLGQLQDKDAEIERLNRILKDKDAEISDLKSTINDKDKEISRLQKLIDDLTAGNPVIDELNKKIKELEDKLKDAYKEIQNLKDSANNNNGGSSGNIPSTPSQPSIGDNDTIINTDLRDNIAKQVIDTVSGSAISVNSGWEVADKITSNTVWKTRLDFTGDNVLGIFTFFDSEIGLFDPVEAVKRNALLTQKEDEKEYAKYTFYARRKSDPRKIYTCDVDIEKSDYTTPQTKITSDNKNIVQSYDTLNTYNTGVSKEVKFTVNADFGKSGKEGIYYQVIDGNEDFDPDSDWIKVEGTSFTVKKPKTEVRVYVKTIDKAGNFTVDKMTGFKPATNKNETTPTKPDVANVPIFNVSKTIEWGNQYNLVLANITDDMEVSFSSSNPKIASVNKKGVIDAHKKGVAVIEGTVSSKDGGYRFKVNVSVVKGEYPKTLNLKPVEEVSSLDGPVLIFYKLVDKGGTAKINVSGLPKNSQVQYKSSNKNIATVDKDGTIKGHKKGTADIHVTIKENNKLYSYVIKARVTDGSSDPAMWDYLMK